HRPGTLHVALDLIRRLALVRRVFIKEGGLQLALPRRVVRERVPMSELPPRVQIEQFSGHGPNRGARLVALALPRRRAQPVQSRRVSVPVIGGLVGLEAIDPLTRVLVPVGTLVLQDRGRDSLSVLAPPPGGPAAFASESLLAL